MNVVALIARRFKTDVCSAYLLEPDRANLVLAATVGLRPECIGTLRMGAARRAWPGWWPSRFARSPSRRCRIIRASNISAKPARMPYQSFLGVPLIDRGVLQGVLVVQTIDARAFQRRRNPHADGGRRAGGAGGQRGPHAGPLHRARAGAAVGAGAQSVVELGQRFQQPVPRSGPGALAAAQSQSRFRCCAKFRWRSSSSARGELVLHGRINYAYRRLQEYLQADRTWGARHAGVLRPRPVAYFSAEFGLHESVPIYSGGLGVLAGDHIKSASDLGIPLVGVGLFYGQGYFRQRLDRERLAAGRISADGRQSAAHGTGHRHERRAGHGADRDPQRIHPRQGLARESGPLRSAAARFRTWKATRPRIAS